MAQMQMLRLSEIMAHVRLSGTYTSQQTLQKSLFRNTLAFAKNFKATALLNRKPSQLGGTEL